MVLWDDLANFFSFLRALGKVCYFCFLWTLVVECLFQWHSPISMRRPSWPNRFLHVCCQCIGLEGAHTKHFSSFSLTWVLHVSMPCAMHSLHSDFHMFVETSFWEWKSNNLCRNPESGSNLHFRRCSIAGLYGPSWEATPAWKLGWALASYCFTARKQRLHTETGSAKLCVKLIWQWQNEIGDTCA